MVNCFAEANAVPKKLVYKLIWQIRTLGSCDVIVHHSYRKCTDGKRTRTLAQDAQLCPVFANCACQFTLCTDTCWRIRLEKLTGRTILKQTKGIFLDWPSVPIWKGFPYLDRYTKTSELRPGALYRSFSNWKGEHAPGDGSGTYTTVNFCLKLILRNIIGWRPDECEL